MVTVVSGTALAASPFDAGDRAQLFVDQALVQSAKDVVFTFHPATKHPKNPLVKADRPEDGWRVALCGSVMYDEDEKLFKMWYLGNNTLYATSQDGLAWQKHDVVWKSYMFASVIKDKADPAPARRYKIIAWCPNAPGVKTPGYPETIRSGYNTSISPDGKQIAVFNTDKTICPHGDVITGYYDRQRQLYVAFPKIMTETRGFRRRCFSIITSKDFVTWTDPKPAFVPDERDDEGALARIEEARPILDATDNPKIMRTEFYGIGVYQHESCVIAFPWIFTINGTGRVGVQEGPGEVQVAISRDLERWERPFRQPCIPRGKPGEWDCGFFWTPNEAVRFGDEIRLYYAASNYGHGHRCQKQPEGRLTQYTASIGLATWKLDRFVSADAPAAGGTLTTVPLVFSGNRLELNAATKDGGSIVVELLDTAGKTLARSKPIVGDSLRHTVTWQDDVKIGHLAGQPVSLKFLLKSAELYSSAFRP
ncbi:MAG: arabinan endo-1,5-alpha-L-arabinosidase [Planctomycetes bacterium]|nr:arabinan endo-1,5-alpha-L-arabinosidase [Planctomycetota bacterium]